MNNATTIYRDVIDNPRLHISAGNVKTGAVPAFNTLPTGGEIELKDGRKVVNVVGTCAGCCSECSRDCYAVSSVKRYRSAAVAWAENTALLRDNPRKFRAELLRWFSDNRPSLFRVHVSGEFMDGRAGEIEFSIWCELARLFDETTFYLYTKRFNLVSRMRSRAEREGRDLPSNLVINYSTVDTVLSGRKCFVWDNGTNPDVAALPHCPAIKAPENGRKYGTPNHGITCDRCRMCANPAVAAVAVYLHR